MAQIAGGETDKRVFLFGAGQLMPTELWGRSTYADRTPGLSSLRTEAASF